MLCLKRSYDERVFIEVPPSTEATLIEVRVVELPGGTFVKLGFEAPQRACIEREEVRARRLAGEPMPRAKAGR
jgi:sRNA-binding carbon storage regulator CsrA